MVRNRIERPPKLHELLAEQIQSLVIEGQWKPGSRLPPERELCVQFGVSRTVTRETVKVLVARGVLRQIAGQGTFVSQNVTEPLKQLLNVFVSKDTSKGYANLFEVRNILEVEIAGLAAERASEQDIENLDQINRTMAVHHGKRSTWSEKDLIAYNELDFQFHVALAKCTGNDFFVVLLTALSGAFKGAWSHTHNHPEVREHGLEMHEAIMRAIRAGKGNAARQATRNNLKAFLADVEQNAKTDGTPPRQRSTKRAVRSHNLLKE
jgi:GntR family transcriptional regulator, transcriptional repressor for pyruvate dehydrogenase complex